MKLRYKVMRKYQPGHFDPGNPIPYGYIVEREDTSFKDFRLFDKEGNDAGTISEEVFDKLTKRLLLDGDVDIMKEVGQHIKKAREMRNMTQKDLASILGTSIPYICKIEKGNGAVSIPQLAKIGQILNYNLDLKFSRKYDKAAQVPDSVQ